MKEKKLVMIGGHEATAVEHLEHIIRRFEKGDQVLATALLREFQAELAKGEKE